MEQEDKDRAFELFEEIQSLPESKDFTIRLDFMVTDNGKQKWDIRILKPFKWLYKGEGPRMLIEIWYNKNMNTYEFFVEEIQLNICKNLSEFKDRIASKLRKCKQEAIEEMFFQKAMDKITR